MNEDDRFNRADRLFDAALEMSAAERVAYLDRECGKDAELRTLVERLLRRTDATTAGGLATGGANGAVPGTIQDHIVDLTGTSLGRYRIVREIGRGGMGVVYEARDDKLQRTVAIKVLPARLTDPRVHERFLREAQAAAALNHPNIVAIHDAGEADGWPYLVMEYVPGGSLAEHPPGSLEDAIVFARTICDALEHAHARELVHRDLKPANVLRSHDGERLIVKLTDMGIALARGAARVTLTGAITGTPTYMAPEQALGKDIDGRADLYSLGVMLYGWVAGRPPFEGDDALAVVSQHIHAPVVPPRTYRPDLPAGLEPIIVKLLSKSAESRFASAAEVGRALSKVGTARAESVSTHRVAIEGLTRGRMVGRRKELEQLQELWRSAVEGHSHMAMISGEPGVGKTRLAFEVTATAQLDGARVLNGGCYENEATTPYLPFLEAFRRVVRESDEDELAVTLGDTAGEIARLAPEIASRLGPFPDRPALSPQEERLRLFDHVARFVRQLAGERGLLFFIDDLQWADHGSLALLHYLLRQLASERVLFLGTYREVELDRTHALSKALVDWNREHLATRVKLDRLSRRDTGRMIATLLGQREVSEPFVASLHDETEGNPFFIEEIVKALIAEGDLVHENATWRRRTTDEFVLPQSVKAAIGSRLERVSEPTGEVLRVAAVLGKMFEFQELASVADRSEDELLDALDEAVASQLIAAGRGEAFAFTHDKIREVLYDEMNPIRRRRLHGRIAEGLERLQDQVGSVAVEDLAHHYIHSGDYHKGLLYADRAASAASGVFAWDEALEMLARARECAEALERGDEVLRIDEAMGDAAFASGDLGRSADSYERAISATEDADRRNVIRGKIGEVYVISGDPRGLDHVGRALDELDAEKHPGDTARAIMIEARYLHLAARLKEAAEMYRSAIDLAEPVGDPDLLIRLYSYLAGTLQHRAELDDSDEISRRCVAIGERDNVPAGVMLGYEFLAENSFYRGRWGDCVRFGESEEALARQTHAGDRFDWSHFRGYALHPMGRLEESERLFRRAIDRCRRTGERRLELFMRIGLAACLLDTGRLEEAAGLAIHAVKEADPAELMAHRIVGRGVVIRVLLRTGRTRDAVLEARTAVELWRSSGSSGTALIYGADFAEALASAGAVDEARGVLDDHLEIADRNDAEHRKGQNLRVRGLLAAQEGRTEDAVTAFDAAVGKFEACGSTIELARVLADRAALRSGGLDSETAESDLTRALGLLDGCGATRAILGPAG